MSKTLRNLSSISRLSVLVVLFSIAWITGIQAQNNVIIRYVRVGGNDLHTGVSTSVDPADVSGAFATIQRAIDEFYGGMGYIHPNTNAQVLSLAPGATYIIDIGPGIYNDPSSIEIPDDYARPGLQQTLILRGPKAGLSPNTQLVNNGPLIREYNPSQEAIIQTSYGADRNGGISNLRTGHRPLRTAPAPNPTQPPTPLAASNAIFVIGCDNQVVFDGIIFEATRNNGANPNLVVGGRIFEVDNSGCSPGQVGQGRVSTTTLTFRQNIFMGRNENPAINSPGLNYFHSVVSLTYKDNRFHNITWDPVVGPSHTNNRGAIAVWGERVYDFLAEDNHVVGNLNFETNTNLPIKTIDNAFTISNSSLRSSRLNIRRNHIAKIRGTAITVNSGDVLQDTVNIQDNSLYEITRRDPLLLSSDPTLVQGIAV